MNLDELIYQWDKGWHSVPDVEQPLWTVPVDKLTDYLIQYPRKTVFINLSSGRKHWPLEPHPSDITAEDVAHGLAGTNRYSGHCWPTYSVAEHAWRCSFICPIEYAYQTLHHDDSEGMGLCDMSRPVKVSHPFGTMYKQYEIQHDYAIAVRFGLDMPHSPEVKTADNIMLLTEYRDIMPQCDDWTPSLVNGEQPDKNVITPFTAKVAKELWLHRHYQLAEITPGAIR